MLTVTQGPPPPLSASPQWSGLALPRLARTPPAPCLSPAWAILLVLLLLLFFLARLPKGRQDTHCCPTGLKGLLGKSLKLIPEAF